MKKNKHMNDIMDKYRVLNNLIETYNETNVKCLSITSNKNNEGKSLIALNIATLLSKNSKKTLFLDFNIYDTKIKKQLVHRKVKAMIDILEDIDMIKGSENKQSYLNDSNIQSCIIETKYDYLSMLSIGNYSNNYNSVVNNENLKVIIEHLKKEFEYLIIDTPSFKNFSYVQAITSASDGCLFVLKEGVNEIDEGIAIKENMDRIGCKVLGCIFNKEKHPTRICKDNIVSYIKTKDLSKRNRDLVNKRLSSEIKNIQ